MVSVLVISISTSIHIGVYDNNEQIDAFTCEGKTSDVLPSLFANELKNYDFQTIYYVNAPGSFMSIKVSYLFLKSLSIIKKIPLMATHGFHFNENSPIRALGKKYFHWRNESIEIDFLDENLELKPFSLPTKLDPSWFSKEALPQYNLPAV